MKKIIVLTLLIVPFLNSLNAQVLTNGTLTPSIVAENPFLDASTNFDASVSPFNEGKGLSFPRTDLTTWVFKTSKLDGIFFPSAFDGMVVYNIGTGSTLTGLNNPNVASYVYPGFYYFYNPGATTTITQGRWVRLTSLFTSSTSNGTSLVSSYSCSTGSTGTLTVGTPVSGVTQTIMANVTTVGTYNISTTNNGVTFTASGTFTGTGLQTIVLIASGTPLSATNSPYDFILNTMPNCNFSRTVLP